MKLERMISIPILLSFVILTLPCIAIFADSVPHSGWGIDELIETGNSGDAQFPQVAIEDSGDAIAVWHQNDGTRFNIYLERLRTSFTLSF